MRTTRTGRRSNRTDLFSAGLLDAAAPDEPNKNRWVLLDDVIRNQEVGKAAMRAQSKATEDWYQQRQKQLVQENEMLAALVKHADKHPDQQAAAAQHITSDRLPEEFLEGLRESRSDVFAQVLPVLINTLKGFCMAAFIVLIIAASEVVPRPEHCARVIPFTPHDGTLNTTAEVHTCAAGKGASALEEQEKELAQREREYFVQKEELNQLQAQHKQQVVAFEERLVEHEEARKAWERQQSSTAAPDADERATFEALLAQHLAEKAALQRALAEHESLQTAFEAEQAQFQEQKEALEQQRHFDREMIETQKTLHDAQKAELEMQKVQFQSDQEQAREQRMELAKARAELVEQEQSHAQAKAELELLMQNVSKSARIYQRSMDELEQMQKQHQSQKQELEQLQAQYAKNEAALEEQRRQQQTLRESFELQVAEHERKRQAYDERASAQLAEMESWKSQHIAKEQEMKRIESEHALQEARLQASRLQLQAEREAFEAQLARHLEAKAEFDQTQSLVLMRQRLKDKRSMQREKDSAHAAGASLVRNKPSVYEAAVSMAQSAWDVLSCLAILYASASIVVLMWWYGSSLPVLPPTLELKRPSNNTSTLATPGRNVDVPVDASSPRSMSKDWLNQQTLEEWTRDRETWSVRQNRVFSEKPYVADEEEKGAKLRSKLVAPSVITSIMSADEPTEYSQEDATATPRAFVDLQVRSGTVVVGDSQDLQRLNKNALTTLGAAMKPCNSSSASRASPKSLQVDVAEAEAPHKHGPGVIVSSPSSSGSMKSFSNYISLEAKTHERASFDAETAFVSANGKQRRLSNPLLGVCPEERAVQDTAEPTSSLLETHNTSLSQPSLVCATTKERWVLDDDAVAAPATGNTLSATLGSDVALSDVSTRSPSAAPPPVDKDHEEAGRVNQPSAGQDAAIARNNIDMDESRSPNAGASAKARLLFSSSESAPAEADQACMDSQPSTPPTHHSYAPNTNTLEATREAHRPGTDQTRSGEETEQDLQAAEPQQSSSSKAPNAAFTLQGILNGAFDNFLIKKLRASKETAQDQQETSLMANIESDVDTESSFHSGAIQMPQQNIPSSPQVNNESACLDALPVPKPIIGGPPRCAMSTPTFKSVPSVKPDRGSASKTKAIVAANLNARAARPLPSPARTSPMSKLNTKTINSTVGTSKVTPSSKYLSSVRTKNRGTGVQTSPATPASMENVNPSARKGAPADHLPSPPPTTPSKPVVQKCTRPAYTRAQVTAMELISKRKTSRDVQ